MESFAPLAEKSQVTLESAINKLKCQMNFCHKEGEKFTRRCSFDSGAFYDNKEQELQWQIQQLRNHHKQTGTVLELESQTIALPVCNDLEHLGLEDLELNIRNINCNTILHKQRNYYLRCVVCMPLQKVVLQEYKTNHFKPNNVNNGCGKHMFFYPRPHEKMVQTLKRGYLSIELYCEKMLKPARLIGRETVQLAPFLNTANLYGHVVLKDESQAWEINYSLDIRVPQNLPEQDNFKTVTIPWHNVSGPMRRVSAPHMRRIESAPAKMHMMKMDKA